MVVVTAASHQMASLTISPVPARSTGSSCCVNSPQFASFSGLSLDRSLRISTAARTAGPVLERRTSLVVKAVQAPRTEKRKARQIRIRKKLTGTPERPRLVVFRSNKHIYAQVIDDTQSHTLAATSTLVPALREELQLTAGPTIDAARRVGLEIAKIALERGVTKVAFDRAGFLYHGRIAALADGAREGGLDF